jgi:mono/diheme cytochrome c family protein
MVAFVVAVPAAAQTSDESDDGEGSSTTVVEDTDSEAPADDAEADSEAPADDAEAGDDGASEADAEQDALVVQGSEVYTQVCSVCHQPGGVGISGQFPPLLNNPNVQDAEYVRDVIKNGRQGEIEVLGEVYDSVMTPQSTLSDDDVDAVIAYIQAGFQVPASIQEEFDEDAAAAVAPEAGTELPGFTDMATWLAYLLPAAIAALVLAPRLVAPGDRLSMPWLDAWLKTGAIVLGIVFLTVVIPDYVISLSSVASLDRPIQDLIVSVVWGAGLLLSLFGLWYAHRESRI